MPPKEPARRGRKRKSDGADGGAAAVPSTADAAAATAAAPKRRRRKSDGSGSGSGSPADNTAAASAPPPPPPPAMPNPFAAYGKGAGLPLPPRPKARPVLKSGSFKPLFGGPDDARGGVAPAAPTHVGDAPASPDAVPPPVWASLAPAALSFDAPTGLLDDGDDDSGGDGAAAQAVARQAPCGVCAARPAAEAAWQTRLAEERRRREGAEAALAALQARTIGLSALRRPTAGLWEASRMAAFGGCDEGDGAEEAAAETETAGGDEEGRARRPGGRSSTGHLARFLVPHLRGKAGEEVAVEEGEGASAGGRVLEARRAQALAAGLWDALQEHGGGGGGGWGEEEKEEGGGDGVCGFVVKLALRGRDIWCSGAVPAATEEEEEEESVAGAVAVRAAGAGAGARAAEEGVTPVLAPPTPAFERPSPVPPAQLRTPQAQRASGGVTDSRPSSQGIRHSLGGGAGDPATAAAADATPGAAATQPASVFPDAREDSNVALRAGDVSVSPPAAAADAAAAAVAAAAAAAAASAEETAVSEEVEVLSGDDGGAVTGWHAALLAAAVAAVEASEMADINMQIRQMEAAADEEEVVVVEAAQPLHRTPQQPSRDASRAVSWQEASVFAPSPSAGNTSDDGVEILSNTPQLPKAAATPTQQQQQQARRSTPRAGESSPAPLPLAQRPAAASPIPSTPEAPLPLLTVPSSATTSPASSGSSRGVPTPPPPPGCHDGFPPAQPHSLGAACHASAPPDDDGDGSNDDGDGEALAILSTPLLSPPPPPPPPPPPSDPLASLDLSAAPDATLRSMCRSFGLREGSRVAMRRELDRILAALRGQQQGEPEQPEPEAQLSQSGLTVGELQLARAEAKKKKEEATLREMCAVAKVDGFGAKEGSVDLYSQVCLGGGGGACCTDTPSAQNKTLFLFLKKTVLLLSLFVQMLMLEPVDPDEVHAAFVACGTATSRQRVVQFLQQHNVVMRKTNNSSQHFSRHYR